MHIQSLTSAVLENGDTVVAPRSLRLTGRCRRLAKDFERSIESAQAWVLIANIRMLTRRLARA